MAPLAIPSSSRMMAISVVMRSSTLISQVNTLNCRLKLIFEEAFCGQKTSSFGANSGSGHRAGRRDFADRADRECVRICRLALRFGVRALAARLSGRHANER